MVEVQVVPYLDSGATYAVAQAGEAVAAALGWVVAAPYLWASDDAPSYYLVHERTFADGSFAWNYDGNYP